jgi:ribosomal protein L7Ae-like RNA K-turn-binding protein
MDNKQKLLNLLGLAQRAGKLITGEEFVVEAIQGEFARLVFVASDAGKNTSKKIHDKAAYYEVPLVDTLTYAELSCAIGKSRKAIAIEDNGFAKAMKKLIAEL